LDAMRDEVIRIPTTPRSLRPRAPRNLTRRRRTDTLATADTPVRYKPMTANTAGPLREHPEMLAPSALHTGGPFLVSKPGSILASAEASPAPWMLT
jgi:hypothetical protein